MQLRPKIAPYIVEIISQLQNAGYEAYIVGGAVRDFLLNRQPKDYDLSTSATPEQIKKVFRDRHVLIIGKRFRLVHLHHHGEIIEISTFRKRPQDQTELRRPGKQAPEHMIFQDNEFGTAEEDAWRRDFTINAIFYDPVNDKIVDYTGMGMKDLAAKTVRSIGDPVLRFEEDPVRILRALKLVGQYDFTMDAETESAVTKCIEFIVHASASRLTLELEKILKNPYGHLILETFHRYGFLKRFLPFIDSCWGTPACDYMMKLLEERNRRILEGKYRDSISLAMSIMTLPFAEKLISDRVPGQLWNYLPDIAEDLRQILLKVLNPGTPTKRAVAAAVRTLMLQERIKNLMIKKLVSHPGYSHARELGIIQNNVMWKFWHYEEQLPPPEPRSEKRRRGRRHGRKRSAVPVPAGETTGTCH